VTAADVAPEPVEDASAGSGVRRGPYGVAAEQYWDAGWRGALPLPAGKKFPPPSGYTGYDAITPSRPDIQAWIEDRPDGNIALHLPDGVIGIDVDAYGDKTGAQTLDEAQRRWGTLPPTWFSSARTDGSGISLYAVPAGTRLATKVSFPDLDLGHIEIVQTTHRYMVVAPSIHPTGDQYRWRTTSGEFTDAIPSPADLPALPQTWIDNLERAPEPEPTHPDAAPVVLVDGQMTDRVRRALDKALEDLSNVDSRHDATTANTLALARLVEQGEPGVGDASEILRGRFVAAVTADGSRDCTEAHAEYERMWTSALDKVARNPTPAPVAELDVTNIVRLADRQRSTPPGSDPEETTAVDSDRAGDANAPDADAFAEKYPTVDWAALLSGDPEPVDWLVPDVVAAGRSYALASQAKVGKSIITFDLVLRHKVRTLYLDWEQSPADLRDRARAMGHGPDAFDGLHYMLYPPIAPLDSPVGGLQLAEIVEHFQPDLVVLDTVSRAVAGDENESATYRDMYRHSLLPLKRAGIAVLRLDHLGKDATKGQRGSSAKGDDVDCVWLLVEKAKGKKYTLRCERQRSADHPPYVEITRQFEPLRHELASGAVMELAPLAPEVGAIVAKLDGLETPTNWGRDKVRQVLPDKVSNDVLAAAIRHRRERIDPGETCPGQVPENGSPRTGQQLSRTAADSTPKTAGQTCPGQVPDRSPSVDSPGQVPAHRAGQSGQTRFGQQVGISPSGEIA
jgi:hypothetical protein